MTKNDGGPAFPGPIFTQSGYKSGEGMGMTLRDWFAGQAPRPPDWWMSEEMPVPPPGWNQGDGPTAWTVMSQKWTMSRLASWPFVYADAMIAARDAS